MASTCAYAQLTSVRMEDTKAQRQINGNFQYLNDKSLRIDKAVHIFTSSNTFQAQVVISSSVLITGFFQYATKSSTTIVGITPGVVGKCYYCNNCSSSTICCSTGTAQYQWASSGDRTIPCE